MAGKKTTVREAAESAAKKVGRIGLNLLRTRFGLISYEQERSNLEKYQDAINAKYKPSSTEEFKKLVPDSEKIKDVYNQLRPSSNKTFENLEPFKGLTAERKAKFNLVFKINEECVKKFTQLSQKLEEIKKSDLPPDAVYGAVLRLKNEYNKVINAQFETEKDELKKVLESEDFGFNEHELPPFIEDMKKQLQDAQKDFSSKFNKELDTKLAKIKREADKEANRIALLYELYNNSKEMRALIDKLSKDKNILIVSQNGQEYDPFSGVNLTDLKTIKHKKAFEITNNGNSMSVKLSGSSLLNPISGLQKYSGVNKVRNSARIMIGALKAQGYDTLNINIALQNVNPQETPDMTIAQTFYHEAIRHGYEAKNVKFHINGKPYTPEEIFKSNPQDMSNILAEGREMNQKLEDYRKAQAKAYLSKPEEPAPKTVTPSTPTV